MKYSSFLSSSLDSLNDMQFPLSDFKGWMPACENSFRLEDSVHIWKIDLNKLSKLDNDCRKFLSAAELFRIDACASLQQRQKFICTRFILRTLLSRYLGRAPQEISLIQVLRGKPELQDPNIQFNLAHSNSTLLLAFCNDSRIGIDLEKLRLRLRMNAVAQRCLAESEFSIFKDLNHEEKLVFFYQRWTLKEALLKAWGEGLWFPMKNIEIFATDRMNQRLQYRSAMTLFPCQIQLLPIWNSDYVAALALENGPKPLNFWNADFLLEKAAGT